MTPNDILLTLQGRIDQLRVAITRGHGNEAARLVGRIHVLAQELWVAWPEDFERTVRFELSALDARPRRATPYTLPDGATNAPGWSS